MNREQRRPSLSGRLARLGFPEPAATAERLADPRLAPLLEDAVLDDLSAAADPGRALQVIDEVLEATGPVDPTRTLTTPAARPRALGVVGLSIALGEHVARHPEQWHVLTDEDELRAPAEVRRDLLAVVGADDSAEPVATRTGEDARDALRVAYRGELLSVAAHDLASSADLDAVCATVPEVGRRLADLAAATLEAALAVARAEHPEAVPLCRLAVIGMGKCGGQELNYVSDVDVVFVAEPRRPDGDDEAAAMRAAAQLAATMMNVCSESTAEGTIWPVDAALRPEGKNGVLVRTLASHLGYYERWAKTWEFQALLKARPVAGDAALGQAYVDTITPLVWRAAQRPHFVEDVQAMRRRVVDDVSSNVAERQIKLGRGGLRDVEFAVQLLQLVHGSGDSRLRDGSTLEALSSLAEHGYVGRQDAADLDRAYRFLRALEHRLQLRRLQRTHVLPTDVAELRVLGRSMSFRTDPVDRLHAEWRTHAREVRRLHEKLFYRPLLQAVARLDPGEARLSPSAAQDRLVALGFRDPAGALRHLSALTSGVSRRAAIQRTLLPVMLGWFADYGDPDTGLHTFRQVSDALGSTPWYLRLLRDEGSSAERLAHVLASSRYVGDLLLRAPEATVMFGGGDELVPRTAAALESEVLAAARRHADPDKAAGAVRAVRRRELLRTAVADVLGRLPVEGVGLALSDIARATLTGALHVATRVVEDGRGGPLPTRVTIIGMGSLGGCELGYSSDADVLWVHDPLPGSDEQEAAAAALAVANEVRRLLSLPAPEPPLEVDADLRPEGRSGPLVRSFASYAAYYARWSLVWESQALLRASVVAGYEDLGERFLSLVEPLRRPVGGLTDDEVREVRRLKARMEGERLPRGADPAMHTKLGPGGLSDIEWTVQLIQLRHGAERPGLRTPRTLEALGAARDAGLLSEDDTETLAEAWRTATKVRNAIMLARGRASDSLPTDAHELDAVARLVGYAPGAAGRLDDDYRRTTRRARRVVDRTFYL